MFSTETITIPDDGSKRAEIALAVLALTPAQVPPEIHSAARVALLTYLKEGKK